MKLRLTVLFAAAFVIFTNLAKAQDETSEDSYEDLRILYMDQKYEKLISKAEHYVENDKTRKDAAPYIYLSKAYFEMSQNEEYAEKYPPDKAFRDALKWASKYRRKDKEGILYTENDFYFQELKKSAIEEAGGLMSDQKYSRAKRYYDGIIDFDPNDAGAWLMLGYCQLQMRATQEAKMAYTEAGKVMSSQSMDNLNSTDRKLLLDGVINYADVLINEDMRDSAKTVLDLAKPALDGDSEFDMYYNKVN